MVLQLFHTVQITDYKKVNSLHMPVCYTKALKNYDVYSQGSLETELGGV